MDFYGIFPPLTTPFAADGSLALDRLRENVGRYNATRLAGYAVAGSTGEAVLLSRDEIERLWAAVREAAAPGKILIAGGIGLPGGSGQDAALFQDGAHPRSSDRAF
jgi:dihydrodipicolinate synthase/N-acetylneuraminate lyase